MSRVLQIAKKALLLLMLMSALGPLAVMQFIAWGGMLWDYSKQGSLIEAVESTFNGENPCNLCLTIQEIEKEQQDMDTGMNLARTSVLLPIEWEEVRFDKPEPVVEFVRDWVRKQETRSIEVSSPPPKTVWA